MNSEFNLKDPSCHEHYRPIYRSLSWTGVIAGALVAISLSFLLNLFEMGIGLSIVQTSEQGVVTMVIGGLIAMAVGGMIVMFAAGWVSGYLARFYHWHRHVGILQGLAAWSLALILTFLLLGLHSNLLTYSSQLLTETSLLNPSAPSTINLTNNDNAPAVNVNANFTSPSQITVNTQTAVNTLGMGALIAFLIFILGAIASCVGGYYGVGQPEKTCLPNDPKKVKSI